MERRRFDDVGFEILEVPDTAPRRPHRRRRLVVLGLLACGTVAIGGGAPATAPPQPPLTFAVERYPARHHRFAVGVRGHQHPALHEVLRLRSGGSPVRPPPCGACSRSSVTPPRPR